MLSSADVRCVIQTDAEAEALGPEFKEAWDRDFKNVKDRPLMIFALYNSFFGDYRTLPDVRISWNVKDDYDS